MFGLPASFCVCVREMNAACCGCTYAHLTNRKEHAQKRTLQHWYELVKVKHTTCLAPYQLPCDTIPRMFHRPLNFFFIFMWCCVLLQPYQAVTAYKGLQKGMEKKNVIANKGVKFKLMKEIWGKLALVISQCPLLWNDFIYDHIIQTHFQLCKMKVHA